MHTALDKACTLMKDSFHIMRAEASEIIAFVASDSTRVPDSNLPPHIPVAYGLKGYSLPMTTMHKMISDVRDQCMDFNVNVRCEVYGGQFLSLVHFSSTGYPLTRLAFLQKYYKELQTWSKDQCVDYLMGDTFVNRTHLDYTVTEWLITIWMNDNEKLYSRRRTTKGKSILDTDDINRLLKGSQLGWRLASKVTDTQDTDYNDNDDDDANTNADEDEDFIVDDHFVGLGDDVDYSDSESDAGVDESDLEAELEDLLNDTIEYEEGVAVEQTFLEEVLQSLCSLTPARPKIDWDEVTVDGLVNDYFRRPDACTKMLHEELNVIGSLVLTHTGIKVFNQSDTKPEKINKLIENMKTSSQKLTCTRRCQNRMKTLKSMARAVVMKPEYSRTYLHIVVGHALFETNTRVWRVQSKIPLDFHVDQEDGDYFDHKAHSYPEFSVQRDQFEYRCIDPGHTLANLHSQISQHGFEFCSKHAFTRVSETNHDVLPKSIIDDKLDRQSIRIAQCFFSTAVEAELEKNGDDKEAHFVKLVHEWYEACDR